MIANCLVLIEYLFTLEHMVQVSPGTGLLSSVIISLLRVHSSQRLRGVTLCVPTEQSGAKNEGGGGQQKSWRQRRTALARRRDDCVCVRPPDKRILHALTLAHRTTDSPNTHTHSPTAATSPAAHSPDSADHSVDTTG